MADQLAFTMENRERIAAVENSFGPSGKVLLEPSRILVGEGRLLKLCRRGPQPKAFFLFNDILVYGSIIVPGRWNSNQQIIPLHEVQQEDLEDGVEMTHQWLIRTPRKSFYVAAASSEEKREWMQHIEECRAQQLERMGLSKENSTGDFAATWIPDRASDICMRCTERFRVTQRKHHCRYCGFIVCNSCSKGRAVLLHISNKPVRVCRPCIVILQEQATRRNRNESLEEASMPEYDASSEEDCEEQNENHEPTSWFNTPQEPSWSPYCYFKPEHAKPPVCGM
ncbi:pleckstrin homology domain-containing family F member 1 [Chanos chanos]|uniref:Pleckstrin homology domain-containing family F member 1 n=1 Tax=Chanos chanos TaxID=29144 RepID=A0A6J2USM3_CHACN|nr:pleckstrin homology domain-containing family F member 1 [Chanos chanos]